MYENKASLRKPEDFEADVIPSNSPASPGGSGELQRRAAQAGAVVGKAVAVVRETREKLHSQEGSLWDGIRRNASERAEELGEKVVEKASDLRRQARSGYERTCTRIRQAGHDYPIQITLAAGIAGFVLGAGLRIWKSRS